MADAVESQNNLGSYYACFVYDGAEDGVLLAGPLDTQIGATSGTFFGTLEQLEEKRRTDREARRRLFEEHPDQASLSVFHTDFQLPPTPIYGGNFVEILSKGEVFCRPLTEHRSEAGTGYAMDQILIRPGGNNSELAQSLFGQEWYVSQRPRGFRVWFTEADMPSYGIVFFPFKAELGRLESFDPLEPTTAQLEAARAKIAQ
ncbi:MAG: hypothetical protein AAFO88_05610 [Pseudomonadota bacterium]